MLPRAGVKVGAGACDDGSALAVDEIVGVGARVEDVEVVGKVGRWSVLLEALER